MSTVLLVVAVFAACAVEGVEALTIVLAVGLTRGWRATLSGIGAALVVLAIVVAALGPALRLIPLGVLRLVVGGLLLVFGLQWLRKAILRAAGVKAIHDEQAIYARTREEAGTVDRDSGGFDGYGFTVAFKGVLLEGLEVVFIVLTFGANQGSIGWAVLGAAGAVMVVIVTGLALRAPLARMPENTLKYGVGVLLTSFGVFWGGEGAGASWPGSDAAVVVLIAIVAATALVLTALLRRRAAARASQPTPIPEEMP